MPMIHDYATANIVGEPRKLSRRLASALAALESAPEIPAPAGAPGREERLAAARELAGLVARLSGDRP